MVPVSSHVGYVSVGIEAGSACNRGSFPNEFDGAKNKTGKTQGISEAWLNA